MKKRVLLSYNRTMAWLSCVLILALIFVIRGSTLPLVFDNRFTRWLFLTDVDADKTLYNIGISYVAAYIFYVIQVYIPERKRTLIAIVHTQLDMLNCIRQCSFFLEGWKEYTERNNGAIIGVSPKLVYYEDYAGHIIQMTPQFLEETVSRILEDYDNVKNNIDFRNADIELQKLLLDMDFPKEANRMYQLLLSAQLLCSNPNSTILETYSEETIAEFEDRLKKLSVIYKIQQGLELKKTEDKNKILAYHKVMKSSYEMIEENLDYFKNLPEGYNKSIRTHNDR